MAKDVATNFMGSFVQWSGSGTKSDSTWTSIGQELTLDAGKCLMFVVAICKVYANAWVWIGFRLKIDGNIVTTQDVSLDNIGTMCALPIVWIGNVLTEKKHSITLEWALTSGTGTVTAAGQWVLGAMGWKR